jgi:ParB family chromosome partitioning protein
MATKKGLGRGLEALLKAAPRENHPIKEELTGYLELPILDLGPGRYQPRREILKEELDPLADSIRSQGIIQPIVVRKESNGAYEIIAGERRWRAAQLAGLDKVPVIIKQVSDESAMAMALIENIQREDLNPLEESLAYERLVKEFNLTHIQIAEMVGKSRVTITNSLRLLTLCEDVKLFLERGEIEVGHAKVLLGLRGQNQSQIARIVVAKGLSVRDTERLIVKFSEGRSSDSAFKKQTLDPDIRLLQDSLSEKLGANVQITHRQQGKGKMVIQYNSLDELEGILDHIR